MSCAIPGHNAGRGGAIVITSSLAALTANENVVHYSAAKAGLVGMMKVIARPRNQYLREAAGDVGDSLVPAVRARDGHARMRADRRPSRNGR